MRRLTTVLALITPVITSVVIVVTVIVFVTGAVVTAFPLVTTLGLPAGLLAAPLGTAPIVPSVVPAAVSPVAVVVGEHRALLLIGQAGQARPRVLDHPRVVIGAAGAGLAAFIGEADAEPIDANANRPRSTIRGTLIFMSKDNL